MPPPLIPFESPPPFIPFDTPPPSPALRPFAPEVIIINSPPTTPAHTHAAMHPSNNIIPSSLPSVSPADSNILPSLRIPVSAAVEEDVGIDGEFLLAHEWIAQWAIGRSRFELEDDTRARAAFVAHWLMAAWRPTEASAAPNRMENQKQLMSRLKVNNYNLQQLNVRHQLLQNCLQMYNVLIQEFS